MKIQDQTSANEPTSVQSGKLKISHNSGCLCVDTEHGETFCTANKPEYAERIVRELNMHSEFIKLAKLTQEMMRGWEGSSQKTFNKYAYIDVDILSKQLLEQAEIK